MAVRDVRPDAQTGRRPPTPTLLTRPSNSRNPIRHPSMFTYRTTRTADRPTGKSRVSYSRALTSPRAGDLTSRASRWIFSRIDNFVQRNKSIMQARCDVRVVNYEYNTPFTPFHVSLFNPSCIQKFFSYLYEWWSNFCNLSLSLQQ